MIFVRHEIQVAHRLYFLPGKCQQIHGHSMSVQLEVHADLDRNGYALGMDGIPIEYGDLKKDFRGYLDTVWDHQLHLNQEDPLAGELLIVDRDRQGRFVKPKDDIDPDSIKLPGLRAWPQDPSTENIARWIKKACEEILPGMSIYIRLEETSTNGAGA
jgi:6-pyruvoyl-tetrahydropterin synthase